VHYLYRSVDSYITKYLLREKNSLLYGNEIAGGNTFSLCAKLHQGVWSFNGLTFHGAQLCTSVTDNTAVDVSLGGDRGIIPQATISKDDKIPGTNSGNLTWAIEFTALFNLLYESK
jgi:hypothetical protein